MGGTKQVASSMTGVMIIQDTSMPSLPSTTVSRPYTMPLLGHYRFYSGKQATKEQDISLLYSLR